MNKQQQAIALFLQLVVAGPKRRKELLKQQFSFTVVIRHEERIVSHGEFFSEVHPPLRGLVTTYTGLVIEDTDGGVAFVPLYPSTSLPAAPAAPAAPAPAPAAPAPVAAPVVISTRTTRVSFGENIEIRDVSFQLIETFMTPSSGAVIEEIFSDGKVVVTFVGSHRQTWTI